MDVLVVLARLLLAGVFLVSGIGKLLDLAGAQQAMVGFGVPNPYAKSAGVALPLGELLIAVLLLSATRAALGGLLALALFLAVFGGISYNLSHGRRPDSHFFGKLHSEPVSWQTLTWTGVLATVAFFVAIMGLTGQPGPSPVAWIERLSTYQAIVLVVGTVLVAALAGMAWLLVHLLGQNGRLLVRFDRIEEALAEYDIDLRADEEVAMEEGLLHFGTPAPAFTLPGVHGETLTLDALRAQAKPVLLIFSDPGCGPCNALMPDIGRWQRDYADKLTVAVISGGARDAAKAKSDEHGLTNVLIQKEREVNDLYGVVGTPTGILVRADGTIGSRAAAGAGEIRTLVKPFADKRAPVPVLAAANGREPAAPVIAPSRADRATIGMPAPAVSLPDLDGRTKTLAEFEGRPTVVLFWNPGCGFCQRMLPDLKAWEESPPQGAPNLLLVSTGDPAENRDLGLRSPILLDQGFQVGTTFGAGGTPSAVLIDEHGNLASQLGVGAPEVLGLLNPIDPAACDDCVAACKEQGGGDACATVCMMAGKCGPS